MFKDEKMSEKWRACALQIRRTSADLNSDVVRGGVLMLDFLTALLGERQLLMNLRTQAVTLRRRNRELKFSSNWRSLVSLIVEIILDFLISEETASEDRSGQMGRKCQCSGVSDSQRGPFHQSAGLSPDLT